MHSNFYTQYVRRLLHLTVGCLALHLFIPPGSTSAHGHTSGLARHTPVVQRTVSGTVVDATGGPLAGVTAVEKNTNSATTTDANGKFQLSVSSSSAVLVFSSIGYDSQDISAAHHRANDITLAPCFNTLQELVIVGYGAQQGKLTSGAIVQVKGDDIQ